MSKNASSAAPPHAGSSSGRRRSGNVGKNHPTAVAARVEAMGCPTKSTPRPALRESPPRASKDRAIANLERMACPSAIAHCSWTKELQVPARSKNTLLYINTVHASFFPPAMVILQLHMTLHRIRTRYIIGRSD